MTTNMMMSYIYRVLEDAPTITAEIREEGPTAEEPSLVTASNDPSAAAFISALVINSALALVFCLIFIIMKDRAKHVYSPRLLLLSKTPPKLPSGPCAWLMTLLKFSDDEIYEYAGIDQLVAVRFFRVCLKILGSFGIYSVGCLIAIFATGGNDKKDPPEAKELQVISYSNVSTEKYPRIWSLVVGVYLLTGLCIYFLVKEFYVYLHYRTKFLSEKDPSQFSIILSEIPKPMRNEESIMHLMDRIFPGQVAGVHFVTNREKYAELLKKHDAAVIKYEAANFMLEKTHERPQHKTTPLCGKKVDSLEHYQNELTVLQGDLTRQFNDDIRQRSKAVIAAQVRVTALPFSYEVHPAAPSSEILWKNLRHHDYERRVRFAISTVAVLVLIAFWTIPVVFISGLSNLTTLYKVLPFLEPVIDLSPAIKGFLQGFLPTLGLKIFLWVLPIILRIITDFEGVWTVSELGLGVMKKYYIFLIVNVLFVVTISGALFKRMKEIIDQPTSLPKLLADSLPSQSVLFTNYVMLNALSVFSGSLARLGPLIVSTLKLKFLAKTNRQKRDTWLPGDAGYDQAMAEHLLILAIGFVYCCISPLVLIFVVVYFAFGYIVELHHSLYVYISTSSLGGKMWIHLFQRIMTSLVIFQLFMIGYCGVKESALGSSLCIVPLIVACLFWYNALTHFKPSGEVISLEEAVAQDSENSMSPSASGPALADAYERFPRVVEKFSLWDEDELLNPYDNQDPEMSTQSHPKL